MPIVAVAFAFAALIWSVLLVLRGSLVVACLGLLAATACLGPYFARFDVGPITITLDRVALVAVCIMYAAHRFLGRTAPKPLARGDLALIALVAWLSMSTLTSDWRAAALHDTASPVWRLLCGYLVPLAVYWIARQSPIADRDLDMVHGALAAFGLYLAATGICEVHRQWPLVFPKYIADPDLGLHFGRARGPMLLSVSYGMWVAVGMLAACVWRRRFGFRGQCLILAAMPVYLAGIFYSYTRSVWLGAAAGLAVVAFASARGARRGLLAIGALCLAIAAASTGLGERIVSLERDESRGDSRESAYVRLVFAHVSWRMFQDQPLVGAGFGQFPVAKLPYLSERTSRMNLESIRELCHHNTFLSLLTETGAVGLGAFLFVLASWTTRSLRIVSDPSSSESVQSQGLLMLGALAVYASQLMFHELSYLSTDNILAFFLAGLTMGRQPSANGAPAATNLPAASWTRSLSYADA